MTTSELRIGNYIQDLVGAPCKIRAINEGGLSIKGGGYSASVEMFKPIKLTEEVLLNCGFKAENIYSNFILDDFEIESGVRIISTNERCSFYLSGDIPDFMKIKIEYVHQLQNLYFALTNKELEICF